ncbi:IS110 family transposase [uncultured Clostridium sp.]|uniref:IS110 family transposase n=1 Tax=uncultured Clostridium sp. TaxID=59620 RepID=UPI0025F926F0|nr:IS110 family transposase [uncultured Clostridium sp.]
MIDLKKIISENEIKEVKKEEDRKERKRLFIGIDIAKEKNFAVILMNENNNKILMKNKFENNPYGFRMFLLEVEKLMKEKEILLDEVIIGVESTGHYWEGLHYFFNKRNFEVGIVKNNLVKLKREAKYPNKGKNDLIDSHCIALNLVDRDYVFVKERDRLMISLKRLTRTKYNLLKSSTQNKNLLRAWLDSYNSVYLGVFTEPFCKTGRSILREFPSPRDIIDKNMEEIKEILKKDKRNKGIHYRLIEEYLYRVREVYMDIQEVEAGSRKQVELYLKIYENLEMEIENIKINIKEVAEKANLDYEKIIKIKGIGEQDIISILAEIGDINNFNTPRELQAFLGLGITGKSSGTGIIKKPKINKAGNRRARSILIFMTINLIDKNSDWKKVYCYYKAYNRKSPKANKKMVVAVACKLIRVIFGMLKNASEFDRNIVFKNLDFKKCNKEQFIEEYTGGKRKSVLTEEELEELFDRANTDKLF